MDLFLGIILGVVGTVIVYDIRARREEARKPRRGRPPKQTQQKKEDEN